jgi:hypothetical protein
MGSCASAPVERQNPHQKVLTPYSHHVTSICEHHTLVLTVLTLHSHCTGALQGHRRPTHGPTGGGTDHHQGAAAVSFLLPAVYCLLSTVCCLPSAVCCLLDSYGRTQLTLLPSYVKVLLLGAGECGKSTILKQLKIVNSVPFKSEEMKVYKDLAYRYRHARDTIRMHITRRTFCTMPSRSRGMCTC